MLKIKDNVDLKELEKFGFKYDNGAWKFVPDPKYSPENSLYVETYKNRIGIDGETHWGDSYYYLEDEILDTLYKLITAGLVERVEEK